MNQLLIYTTATGWPEWNIYDDLQTLIIPNASAIYNAGYVQFLPCLAKNWTVSSDGMTYNFSLRQGVTFSNGDPLNSYQVWAEMYGFYYLSGNSSTWLNSYPVFDMSPVNFGPSTINLLMQSGVINPSPELLSIMSNSSWPIYVSGPYNIIFHLSVPFNWFLGALVTYIGLIFDTQYVLVNGGFGTPAAPNSYFNTHPTPGTGPYMITQVQPNAYAEFTQNPTYWGRNLTAAQIRANPYLDPGHVKNVILNYKQDDVVRYGDLSSGTAQIAAIESADWNLILANPAKFAYLEVPNGALNIELGLNTQIYPTNITDVRQAIVHAINYTDLANKAFFGDMSPFMGPEYPAWKQFYDLGNFPPYQYNLTLADQYLAKANITSMPTFLFRVESGCSYCITTAEVVQADLSQINITVNIEVLTPAALDDPIGAYTTEVPQAAQIGQISITGDIEWAPSALTPADDWVTFVSNGSVYGNYAIYSNPVVQNCVNLLTGSTNIQTITSACTLAQRQIYNDAPYAWVGACELWYCGGSLAWDKNVVAGFYPDAVYTGSDTLPIFNTVTFVGEGQ